MGKATAIFWCPFHPFLGAFILQGKLLDVRQNLESKLNEILKNFSEVGNIRRLSNSTNYVEGIGNEGWEEECGFIFKWFKNGWRGG